MRFPSFHQAWTGARAAATRFPEILLCAVVATVAFQVAVDGPDEIPVPLGAAALLGLPLFLALAVTWERGPRGTVSRILLALGGFGLLAAVFMGLHTAWTDEVSLLRTLQLAVAFHMLAAVLPFTGRGETADFWQYNRLLLLAFLLATLYAIVLFVGLALAVAALDHLFGVDVPGDAYARLWIGVAFLFHPWFFLAQLPERLEGLAERLDYPPPLEAFSRFLLVPLTLLYLVILTAYLGRVLITRTWPSGWIGWLVSGVSVVGILALLLVHPLREDRERRWIRTYGRWFFASLLPSVAMLLAAVWQRIDQYGITERRYFLGVLALWLGGTAVYFTVTRSREIRVIPITLAALALLSFAGPWSAYAVSRASQAGRLEGLLREHRVLVEEATRPAPGEVPLEARREVSGALHYLLRTHGPEALPAWAVPTAAADPDSQLTARDLMEGWGMEYVAPGQIRPDTYFTYHAARSSAPRSIRGYAWSHRLTARPVGGRDARSSPYGTLTVDTVRVAGRPLRVDYVRADTVLRLARAGYATVELPLGPLLRALEGRAAGTAVPPESLRVEASPRPEAGEGSPGEAAPAVPGAALLIHHLSGERTVDGIELLMLDADLLLADLPPAEERADG